MNKINVLSFALVVMFLANMACLFVFLGSPKHRPEGPKVIIAETLGFDKSQMKAYDELIASHRASIEQYDDSIQVYKSNLYLHLNASDSLIQKYCVDQINQFQKRIEYTHLKHFNEIKQLCKPNQLKSFDQLQSRLAELFKKPHR